VKKLKLEVIQLDGLTIKEAQDGKSKFKGCRVNISFESPNIKKLVQYPVGIIEEKILLGNELKLKQNSFIKPSLNLYQSDDYDHLEDSQIVENDISKEIKSHPKVMELREINSKLKLGDRNAFERSWSIPKKEAYAALKAVKKFLVYIDGQALDLLLDSKICTQIANTKDLNGKDLLITSWIVEILMLVPLTKIYPIDREENQTADALSNIGTINVQALTFELDPKVTTLINDPKKIKEIMDEAHFSHLGRDYMRTTIKYLFNVEIPHLEKEIMNYLSKCKICLQESTGKTPIFYNVTNPSDYIQTQDGS
jgi:hypothetical protein